MSRTKVIADLLAAALGQVDAFLEAVLVLDGQQRALVLARGYERLGRPVGARPRNRDEIPAPGCWEAYGEVEQLDQLLQVFRACGTAGRWHLIGYARELKAAEPVLPPGYSR